MVFTLLFQLHVKMVIENQAALEQDDPPLRGNGATNGVTTVTVLNGDADKKEEEKDDEEDDMSMDGVEVEIKSPIVSPGLGNLGKVLALKNIAGKWKKKAGVKKKDLNLAFSDTPLSLPPVDACHAMYWTKRRSVPLKNYHDEARAIKDISKFLENPVVLFKVKEDSWKDIARTMLENLKVLKPALNLNVGQAMSCLESTAGDHTIPERVQGLVYNKQADIISEQSFVIVLGSTPG